MLDVYGLGEQWGVVLHSSPRDDDNFVAAGERDAVSETDYYQKVVRRRNFVSLLLDNNETDRYIVTHLYGALQNLDHTASHDLLQGMLNQSALNLS